MKNLNKEQENKIQEILKQVREYVQANKEKLLSEYKISTITHNEYVERIKDRTLKSFSQGDGKIGNYGEILHSTNYTVCLPVIGRELLNLSNFHLHFDANTQQLSDPQYFILNEFPEGLLSVLVIVGDRGILREADSIRHEVTKMCSELVNLK